MKRLPFYVVTCVILAFWGTMNTMVYMRQQRLDELGRLRAGFTDFIGSDLLRERWLSVYRAHKKIGYTGMRVEKVFAVEGIEFHSYVESAFRVTVLGMDLRVRVTATMEQDDQLQPRTLSGRLTLGALHDVHFAGEREGERFVMTVWTGTADPLRVPIPLEDVVLSNGLTPVLPVGGLKVGESFDVRYFDPIRLSSAVAHAEVKAMESRDVDGYKADVYRVETTFSGTTSTSYVTRDGVVLRQEFGPPFEEYVLRRETRERAKLGFEK